MSKITKQNQIEANLSFYKLPFSFGDGAVFLSSNLLFSFDEKNGPYMNVLNFEAELNSPKINFIPKLQLDANITKYGAQINSLTYSDSYSLMEGFSTVLINSNQNNLESVGVQLSLKNALNNEAITMEANFSNPELKSFSMQNILEALYMDVQIKIANINLNRISKIKHENNQITASVFATGPINNPYLVMNIENMTMRSPNDFMDVKGIVSLEDKRVTVNDFSVEFSRKKLENIKLDFNLNTFDLAAQAKFVGTVAGLDIQIPIYFDISEVLLPKGGFIPKSCKIDLQVKDTYGLFTLKPINAHLTGLYSEGNVVIFSPLSDGVYGNYSKDGTLDFTLNLEDLIKANVAGSVTKNNLNVKVSDLSANLQNIFAYFNLNRILIVENGQLDGSLNITGELLNPYLLGALKISKPKVKTPMFCNDSISTETILATVNKDEIKVIPHIIDFILVKNHGAVFGILQGKMILFYIVTFFGLAIFGYLLKDGNLNTMPFYTIGLSLMIAGTIGNFIDRVCFNYVRDFITFGFFSFPSFNVADMCMCVGIVMFFIDTLFGEAKVLWK